MFFFFKQKTAYEMCISNWSSDVCSSDLDLKNAALGFVEIAKAMSAVMPTDSENMMRQNAPIKNMALLRLDGRMRLQSINREPIPASVFTLPAKPQKFGGENFGNLMRGMKDRKSTRLNSSH